MSSDPINGTFLWRLAVRLVLKIATQRYLNRFFKFHGGVLFLSGVCIKASSATTLAEAHCMQFISKYTSVPVPDVYCAFTHKGRTYIVMERIRGKDLSSMWPSLSDESKRQIFSKIKTLIEEIRRIPPPGPGVANINGGPIWDCRLPTTNFWGPFETVRAFHLQLRNGITRENIDPERAKESKPTSDLLELISLQENAEATTVFTHGDLTPLNILIRNDGVVYICDWATSGWLPHYWEYTTAWYANPQVIFWRDEVDNFLTPYPDELRMENIRRSYFGDF